MPKARSLSPKDVRRVFKLYARGNTMQALADKFGVSRTLISFTLSGKRNQSTVIPDGNYRTFKVDDARYAVYDDGRVFSIGNMKFLKPYENNGYVCYKLGPHSRTRYAQRLVLRHFVGKPEDGQEACHNNGKKTDNRLKNLRWDSHSGNNKDKQRHKTALNGEKNHWNKMPDKLLSHLLFAYKHSDLSLREFAAHMADRVPYSRAHITSVLKRKFFNEGVIDKWNKMETSE